MAVQRVKRTIKKSVESDIVTLHQAFEEYIMEKEIRGLSPATLVSYKDTIRLFVEFHNMDVDTDVNEITLQHFFKWINDMKIRGVKHTSINHYLRDMRAFVYWCMHEDRSYIEKPFKVQMTVGQEEPLKMFTDEDIEALLIKPRRNDSFIDWRTWAIVNWVLATGNRASTICSITIGDINFKDKEITLPHTKNKKAQIIPLSSSLEIVIKEYIRMWRKDAPKCAYLFCNIGEEFMTTNALRHSFGRYCKARGVEQTNIHGLRHNFAKAWVKANGNMFALQKILGHSSLDMTRKYVKLFSEDIKDDFDKFNPLDTIKRSSKRTQSVRRNEW